eukprot:5384000-Pleurochrysis_carterae.AAC.1
MLSLLCSVCRHIITYLIYAIGLYMTLLAFPVVLGWTGKRISCKCDDTLSFTGHHLMTVRVAVYSSLNNFTEHTASLLMKDKGINGLVYLIKRRGQLSFFTDCLQLVLRRAWGHLKSTGQTPRTMIRRLSVILRV